MADPSALADSPVPSEDGARRVVFAPDDRRDWREVQGEMVGCTRCELHRARTKVVVGEGPLDADLMIVGSVPGRTDDLQGKPFAGGPGNVLTNLLTDAGLVREECYVTNVVKCLPPGRPPTHEEVETCLPYLLEEIGHVSPSVIVTLGVFATRLLLRRPVPLDRIAGYRFDVFDGITLVPTHHPADAMKGNPSAVASITRDLRIAKAVLDGRLATGAETMAGYRTRRDAHPVAGRAGAGTAARRRQTRGGRRA